MVCQHTGERREGPEAVQGLEPVDHNLEATTGSSAWRQATPISF